MKHDVRQLKIRDGRSRDNPVIFKVLVGISNTWTNKQTSAGLHQWHRHSGSLKAGLGETTKMTMMVSLSSVLQNFSPTLQLFLFAFFPCPPSLLFRPQRLPCDGAWFMNHRRGRNKFEGIGGGKVHRGRLVIPSEMLKYDDCQH